MMLFAMGGLVVASRTCLGWADRSGTNQAILQNRNGQYHTHTYAVSWTYFAREPASQGSRVAGGEQVIECIRGNWLLHLPSKHFRQVLTLGSGRLQSHATLEEERGVGDHRHIHKLYIYTTLTIGELICLHMLLRAKGSGPLG